MDSLRTRAPFFGAALAAFAGGIAGTASGWIVLLVLGIAAWTLPRSWLWYLAACAIFLSVFRRDAGLQETLERARQFSDGTSYSEMPVSGVLTVGRLLRQGRGERFGSLKMETGTIGVLLGEDLVLEAGEVIQVVGALYLPGKVRNPGQFSRRDFWKSQYLAAGLRIDEQTFLRYQWRGRVFQFSESLSTSMRKIITLSLAEEDPARKIILAMVMGKPPKADSEITKAFRCSGAMHVFAVSGLHVNLVATLFFLALMLCNISRRKAILAVIIVMILYALITGFRPPAVRATLMTVIFLCAFLLRRRPSLFNALALSLIGVVFWRPAQVWDIGFQLSYGVLAAIGVGFHFFHRFTRKIAQEDAFMPTVLLSMPAAGVLWLRRYVAAALATSTPAWLGSLPLMATQFGLVTPVAILASVFLIPLTFAVLGLGLLSVLLGLLSPTLSVGVNQLNRSVALASYRVAGGFSKLPGGNFTMPARVPADLIVFDTADGGAVSYLNHHGGVCFDLGSEKSARQILMPTLARWSAPVRTVILTHPDGRHIGGLQMVSQKFPQADFLLPVRQARSPVYREFVAKAEHFEVMERGRNKRDYLEVIRAGVERDISADDRGVVLRISHKGWRILLMGDAGFETEEEIIRRDISCDLIVMGRHGEHGYSGTGPFLRATGAQVIIVSGANFPSTEKVPDHWRKMVAEMGIKLFWQRETGGVLVSMNEERLELQSHLLPEKNFIILR